MSNDVVAELAPNGTMRAGINMSNPLLVTGRTVNGDPVGVSPDMAAAIADRLGVQLKLVQFPSPGVLADAMADDVYDIGLIAVEPARAETIAFTDAYVEIEATYLVPPGSHLNVIADVDKPGIRVAVSARSAYDLYLTRTLEHAELVRAQGLGGAFQCVEMAAAGGEAPLRGGIEAHHRLQMGFQVIHTRAGFRRYPDDRRRCGQVEVAAFAALVDLVAHQGQPAGIGQAFDEFRPDLHRVERLRLATVDQQQHPIRLLDLRPGALNADLLYRVRRVAQPGGIDHAKSEPGDIAFAFAPVTGNTRRRMDQRRAAPDQTVEQRRFPNVWTADYGQCEIHYSAVSNKIPVVRQNKNRSVGDNRRKRRAVGKIYLAQYFAAIW